MENKERNPEGNYGGNWEKPHQTGGGKVMAGLLLVTVGVVVLVAKLDLFFLPRWLFKWEVILIVLGLFLGFRHNFQKPGWLILVLIGTIFLIEDVVAGFDMHIFFWPVMLIGLGVWIMLKPRRDYPRQFHRKSEVGGAEAGPGYTQGHGFNAGYAADSSHSTEDIVDATAIFGGIKKNIISKNFLGGEIVSVFGGTELNLSQADIQHPVMLEATQIFGGTTLIIPPHWQIKSEMVAILGGIDDKRLVLPGGYDPNKVLMLRGTTLFGGLKIKSF